MRAPVLTLGRVAVFVAATLAAVPAPAAPGDGDDPVDVYRRAARTLHARAAAWWDAFPAAERSAVEAWHEPLRRARSAKVLEPVPDEGPVDDLYRGWADIEDARAAALRALGGAGDRRALPILWKEALGWAAEVEASERAATPEEQKQAMLGPEQEHSVRLHGLARRRAGLADALGGAPGAAGFLADEGLQEATRADARSRGTERRTLVADALARIPGEAGRPALLALLGDPAAAVRIAAVEGLARAGGLPADEGVRLLADAEPAVRFAVAEVLRASPPADPKWVGALVDAYLAGTGRWRHEALEALRRATGRTDGDDPTAWFEWLASVADSVEDGTLRRPDGPAPAPLDAPATAARAWGIPLVSDRLLLAADGWDDLLVPADRSLQSTRSFHDWTTGSRAWRKEAESVGDVVGREFAAALAALPSDARFRLLLTGHPSNARDVVTWFPERAPADAADSPRRRAAAFLADFKVGMTENFQRGLRLLLSETWADTALLVTNGHRKLGRFLCGEALVEDFARHNRFRRLRLHVVHVMEHGAETARVLRRLAEVSGGTCVRAVAATPR